MGTFDPRMKGFRQRTKVADVDQLLSRIDALTHEDVATVDAHGRVLAVAIEAPHDVPSFDRSAMDGYALRGEDTFGASAYGPISLEVLGTSLAGHGFDGEVGPGQAVRIMTGAPVPAGADSVLRAEDANERDDGQRVEATAAVPPHKHVSPRGEDIRRGDRLLDRGRMLRPQDIGVLVSTGVTRISVVRRPRVDVIVTGDELLPAGQEPEGHRIVDSNSSVLAGLVIRDGGELIAHEIIPDDRSTLKATLEAATGDVILVTGGTSVGMEDHAPEVLQELGTLPVHGVAMRPSSPTGVGFLGARPAFLLPGNPVSCLCAYDFFAGPTIRALGGRSRAWPYVSVTRPLTGKITSVTGRVDYARVRLDGDGVAPISIGGASVLSSTTRADGFIIVPHDDEGLPAGETVTVYLYG